MRRAVRVVLRVAVAALLVAAIANLPAPGGTAPPLRVRVVDASGSVRAQGARDALRLLRAANARGPFLAFGGKAIPFDHDLPAVPHDATDLGAALEAAIALAGRSGDIVIATDGRDTEGGLERALLIAQERGVPVHVLPIGALDGVDVRIADVQLPASVPPGARFDARVTIESTGPARGHLNGVAFQFASAGRQTVVLAGMDAGPRLPLRLVTDDACPENDAVDAVVLVRDARPRVRAPEHVAKLIPGAVVAGDPSEFDAVVVDSLDEEAARACLERGVGLIALGGSRSYAMGGWAGTTLERALPLWAYPEERTSAVFVLDRSGSMNGPVHGTARRRIDFAVAAVEEAVGRLHPDDTWALVTFAGDARVDVAPRRGPARIEPVSPGGNTVLRPALQVALDQVQAGPPGRRLIVLITDGETEERDLDAVGRLIADRGARLVIVATAPTARLDALGGALVSAPEIARLPEVLGQAIARARTLFVDGADVVSRDNTPWPRGLRINRTSAKPGADVLASSGDAPVVATAPAGRGRAAAVTFALESGWGDALATWPGLATLMTRLVDDVAPPAPGLTSASATHERGHVVFRVRAAVRVDAIDAHPAPLARVTGDLYEARVPARPGTTVLRVAGRAVAAFTLPHAPEYASLGPDGAVLRRIAERTGGRLLESAMDLERLPFRAVPGPRPGRALYVALALALFLVDILVGVFWRV